MNEKYIRLNVNAYGDMWVIDAYEAPDLSTGWKRIGRSRGFHDQATAQRSLALALRDAKTLRHVFDLDLRLDRIVRVIREHLLETPATIQELADLSHANINDVRYALQALPLLYPEQVYMLHMTNQVALHPHFRDSVTAPTTKPQED